MEDQQTNGNVIEIIGGDVPIDDHQSMESGKMCFKTQSFGSSNFMMENQRSCKDRHCKNFYTEMGGIYGDQCGFLHDEQSRIRDRNAIILSHGSSFGYGNSGANGNEGPPPTNVDIKPPSWRTKICNKWEMSGYCPFGSRCTFAHGVEELQRYGGGLVVNEAKPNNQGLMLPNMIAPSGSSMAGASGSRQLPGTVGRPWKGPDKINRIYGDWINDI
ncbi:hypothetical protein L2E82_47989 [Cichorium intybus]|uniref:Uncharacterized protein n=1 Tax=Cichorium intybus TaxID=13427 RepID=A0ACB8YYA6_CICIN|nr:hypothetical protein L2E82_47989 [Cichorium intybus]